MTAIEVLFRRHLGAIAPGSRFKMVQALREFTHRADGAKGLTVLCSYRPRAGDRALSRYRDKKLAAGLSTGTVSSILSCLRGWTRVLRRARMTEWNPDVRGPTIVRVRDVSGPSIAQVQAMMGAVDRAAKSGDRIAIRDAAVLRWLIFVRRSELCRARLADLVAADRITVRLKGRRRRETLHLHPATARAFAAWLLVRGREPGPLFYREDRARPRTRREGLSGHGVRLIVRRRAESAGLSRAMSPNRLRHFLATTMESLRAGHALQVAVGNWKELASVMPYVDNKVRHGTRAYREAQRQGMALLSLR